MNEGIDDEVVRIPRSALTKLLEISFLTPNLGVGYQDEDGRAVDVMCWGSAPLNFQGPPGIGKTAAPEQLARLMGEPYERLNIAKQGLSLGAIRIPISDEESGEVGLITPADMRLIERFKSPSGIMVFDEITNAPPMIQALFLDAIDRGEIGEAKMPPRWRKVMFSNPPNSATDVNDLRPAVCGRMGILHIDTIIKADVMAARMNRFNRLFGRKEELNADIIKKPLLEQERDILPKWQKIWPRVQGAYAGFAQLEQNLYEANLKPNCPQPEPRTWDYAMDLYTTYLALDVKEPQEVDEGRWDGYGNACVGAYVGSSLATSFLAYYTDIMGKIPEPADILSGKVPLQQVSFGLERLDLALATLEGCAALLRTTTPVHSHVMVELLHKAMDVGLVEYIAGTDGLVNSLRTARYLDTTAQRTRDLLQQLGRTARIN